jgi:hypothetical protein
MKDYHINIFYSNQDEGYIADLPGLKYCWWNSRREIWGAASLEG